jgi:mono/diheme cytochrome c family protein
MIFAGKKLVAGRNWVAGTRNGLFAVAMLALGGGFAAGVLADSASVIPDDEMGGRTGEEIFTNICQGCHMPGAVGAVGAGHYPKLAGDPALVSWQYVALTVVGGRKAMPAFGTPLGNPPFEFGAVRLSDAQIAEVVNYVRSNFGNKYKEQITASQVATLPHPGSSVAP